MSAVVRKVNVMLLLKFCFDLSDIRPKPKRGEATMVLKENWVRENKRERERERGGGGWGSDRDKHERVTELSLVQEWICTTAVTQFEVQYL